MVAEACGLLKEITGKDIRTGSGSTDCNIPLSMGIPAVCFGVYEGHGAHTREEWVDIESTRDGMKILSQVLLSEMQLND